MQPAAQFMQVQLRYASSEYRHEVLQHAALQKDYRPCLYPAVAAATGAYTAVFWDELEKAWATPDIWEPRRSAPEKMFPERSRC